MRNKHFLLILIGCFIASACSQKEKRTAAQPEEKTVAPAVTYDYVPTVTKEDSQKVVEDTKEVQQTTIVHETISNVEDAYEEGAAQAEEDRLAGHPGMNYADDYEDDDENEAYEEGYEDE